MITSPVKRFPGTIELHDPLTFPMLVEWDLANRDLGLLQRNTDTAVVAQVYAAAIRGIIPCVKTWNLEGFPEVVAVDTFPASPREAVAKLIQWLMKSISAVVLGDETIPPA